MIKNENLLKFKTRVMDENIKHPEIKKSDYIDKYHAELNNLIDALL